jgi:hypothetical protein
MLMIQYGQSSTQANRHDITTASSLLVFPPSGVPMHGNADSKVVPTPPMRTPFKKQ